jgi:hypothetical protein
VEGAKLDLRIDWRVQSSEGVGLVVTGRGVFSGVEVGVVDREEKMDVRREVQDEGGNVGAGSSRMSWEAWCWVSSAIRADVSAVGGLLRQWI